MYIPGKQVHDCGKFIYLSFKIVKFFNASNQIFVWESLFTLKLLNKSIFMVTIALD